MIKKKIEELSNEERQKGLENLVQHPSWKLYKYLIEEDEIKPLREKLLTGQFTSIEEVNAAQERLTLVENLVYAPDLEIISLKDDRN